MNVFFISQRRTLEKVFSAASTSKLDISAQSDIFIYWDWFVKLKLEEKRLRCEAAGGLIFSDVAGKLDKITLSITKNWYVASGGDFTLYKGYSLGNVAEFNIVFAVGMIVKWIACVATILEHHHPQQVFHDLPMDSEISKVIQLVCQYYGIETRRVEVSGEGGEGPVSFDRFTYSSFRTWSGPIVPSKLKLLSKMKFLKSPEWLFNRRGVIELYKNSDLVKRLLFYLLSFFLWGRKFSQRRKGGGGKSIPAVLIYSNASIDLVLEEWKRTERPPFGVVFHSQRPPTIKIVTSLIFRHPVHVDLFPHTPVLKKFASDDLLRIHQKWEQIRKEKNFREIFSFAGVDFFQLIHPTLEQIIQNDFPQIASQIESIVSHLVHMRIRAIVVPYDSPPLLRLTVLIGKRLGIPTLVLQHGVYALKDWDEDRKTAQLKILWGDYYRNLYLEDGTPLDNIFVSGNPLLDRQHPIITNLKASGNRGTPVKNILIITTNPPLNLGAVQFTYCEEFVNAIFLALGEKASKLRFTIKIHPSESLEYYKSLLSDLHTSATITRDSNIGHLLSQNDLVITSVTTVALESQAFGKPTICVDLSCSTHLPPFDGSDALTVVRNVSELKTALDLFVGPHRMAPPFDEKGYQAVQKYLGPLDGKSSLRILEAISESIANRALHPHSMGKPELAGYSTASL